MLNDIQILTADKIDRSKWNKCVDEFANGLIYSQYDYLNCMCDNWDGLVINDYNTIMALPWRKKFGIRYLYQPAFIQQLGLIGSYDDVIDNILSPIYSFSKYGDILFNFSNTTIAQSINAVAKVNLVIDLSRGYEAIKLNYKKDLVLNLKKTEKENLYISNDIALAITMYKDLYQQRMSNLYDADYTRFQSLCISIQKEVMCFTRKVIDDSGKLLAIGLFLKDTKRIYNLMNSTTEIGRSKEANHFLLDSVIKEFAGQNLLFDFEGSDLPGVKSFYEKFGAVDQPYFCYHYNRLPKLIRLIKP